MPEQDKTHNVQELIARYNQELMALYRQQSAPAAANWLDEEYPAPAPITDTPPQEEQPPTSGRTFSGRPEVSVPTYPYTDGDLQGEVPYPEDVPMPPATEEAGYVGYLRVFVFTGRGAEPLVGAQATVTRERDGKQELYANVLTDIDGFTPVISLPSVNPELTMQPEIEKPYIPYDVLVSADGFGSVLYKNIAIYGGNSVTQPAAMLPLLPGEDPTVPRVYDSEGPADL